jgi:uncharacterized protein YqeY
MALKEQIQTDLKAALLSGDRFAAETLRGLKAAILNEEVAQSKRDAGLADSDIEKIIVREVKKRNESSILYAQNDRPESAADEQREAEILIHYLPQQLSEGDIQNLVETTINEMGATGMQSMGLVIAAVKQKAGNTADGATVARFVKQALSPDA